VAYSKPHCQLSEIPSEKNTGVICFAENEQGEFSLICDELGLMRITICDGKGNYVRAGAGIALVRV